MGGKRHGSAGDNAASVSNYARNYKGKRIECNIKVSKEEQKRMVQWQEGSRARESRSFSDWHVSSFPFPFPFPTTNKFNTLCKTKSLCADLHSLHNEFRVQDLIFLDPANTSSRSVVLGRIRSCNIPDERNTKSAILYMPMSI